MVYGVVVVVEIEQSPRQGGVIDHDAMCRLAGGAMFIKRAQHGQTQGWVSNSKQVVQR